MIIAGLTVSLVELPTFHLKTESLVEVAMWLSSMYTFGYQITGIVYLYPVDQADKPPSTSKLRVLQNLVGLDAVKDVVLVTTNWSQVSETNGASVENTTLKPWWSSLIEGGGSAMLRWLGDRESALEVINYLISRPTRPSTGAWKVQRELAVEGRPFPETGVGRALNKGLEKRQQHYIDQLEAILPQAAEIVGEGEESTVVELTPEERKARAGLESVREELLTLQSCTSGMKTQEEDTKRFFRFMAHWERRLYKIRHQAFLGKGELDTRSLSPLKSEQPACIARGASLNPFPWWLLLLALNLGLGAYAVFDMFRNSCTTTTSIWELRCHTR